MQLYKYRIIVNRDKTVFKLQVKAKILAFFEQISTEVISTESIALPILIAICFVFPIIPLIILTITGDLLCKRSFKDVLRSFFSWKTITVASCPLELEKAHSVHKEENQVKYPDKKSPEYTVFMKL